jgi:hypothetical protein
VPDIYNELRKNLAYNIATVAYITISSIILLYYKHKCLNQSKVTCTLPRLTCSVCGHFAFFLLVRFF